MAGWLPHSRWVASAASAAELKGRGHGCQLRHPKTLQITSHPACCRLPTETPTYVRGPSTYETEIPRLPRFRLPPSNIHIAERLLSGPARPPLHARGHHHLPITLVVRVASEFLLQ